LLGAQTAGKHALMVMLLAPMGNVYVQHGALLPQFEQLLPGDRFVQKHGIPAGML